MKLMVIGYGNPLRSDDRVGHYVADCIARHRIPGVETRVTQQLHVELAAELADCDAVLMVDASEGGRAVEVRRASRAAEESPFTHHLTPELLLSLTDSLYDRRPALYVCTLRGEEFGFGVSLSDCVLRRAERLSRRIVRVIKGASSPTLH